MKIKFILFLLLTPFFLPAQNDGDNFFGSDQVHTINITFWQTDYWDSLEYYYTLDAWMQCDIEIDGLMLESSAMQLKGNSSYSSYPGNKKSMNLDFNEYIGGQDYDGLNKLNLNNGFKDPTMMREKVFLEFCRMAGIPAPRCTYAKVYINGTYWGLYTAVEQVNKSFCGIQFVDNDGNLFKGDPHGTLQWKGATESLYYSDYELKTNEAENDWSDLVDLLNKINNSGTALADSLNSILDVWEYMESWAASNIFVNLDSYIGSGHNYYIYHDSVDFKFHWITWDVNEAFGNFNQGMDLTQIKNLDIFYIPSPQQSRPLNYNILLNATLKQQYVDAYCLLASNYFTSENLEPIIDSLADKIRADLYADTMKMFSNEEFETNIETDISIAGLPGGGNISGLKQFITERHASLETQLAALGCYLSTDDVQEETFTVSTFPNPVSDILNIEMSSPDVFNPVHYSISDITGRKYLTGEISEKSFSINFSGLSDGIYILNIDHKIFKKIQVIH